MIPVLQLTMILGRYSPAIDSWPGVGLKGIGIGDSGRNRAGPWSITPPQLYDLYNDRYPSFWSENTSRWVQVEPLLK